MSHLLARCLTGGSIAVALGILIAKYPAFRFYHAPAQRPLDRGADQRSRPRTSYRNHR